MNIPDLEKTAQIMLVLTGKLKVCKRNKSGKINGNAARKIVTDAAIQLQQLGWERGEAYMMGWRIADSKN